MVTWWTGAVLCLTLFSAVLSAQDGALPLSIADGMPRAPSGTLTVDVTLRFDAPVPGYLEIVRLVRGPGDRLWRIAGAGRSLAMGGRVAVSGAAGVETLLLMRAPGHPGYMLDGPFRWPSQSATYFISPRWLKTVRGRFDRSGGSIVWVGAKEDSTAARPACTWTSGTDWECVGVPLDDEGVAIVLGPGQVNCAIPAGGLSAAGVQTTRARSNVWGRLLVVSASTSAEVRVAARRMQAPRARPQSIRLEAVPDERVVIDRIGAATAWLSGAGVSDDGWLEIATAGRATERTDMREITGGPPDLPLRIALQPAASISGRVTAGAGSAAAGAVVTLYRFVSDRRDPDKPSQKRVMVAEIRADRDGAFRIDDLAVERYELIAMHPEYGRGDRRLEPDDQEIEIALHVLPHAIGRVVRDGIAAPGIRVAVVPDLAQFGATGDITELRGGETETDQDGRFSVSLAARGLSELRVGGEGSGVRRVRLGDAESQPRIIDVGTLDLSAVPPLTLVLEGAGACELLMTGPAGRAGMTVVRATRLGPAMFHAALPEPGRWLVVAVCDGRERAVLPAVLEVAAAARDVTIRLTWPQ